MSEFFHPQPEGEPSSFAEGDYAPLMVRYLETPTSPIIGNPDHLRLMATDEGYLRSELKPQLLAELGDFYVTTKLGSYTYTAPDLMVMLARAKHNPPEAHLYELEPEDLQFSLHLVEQIRDQYIAHGVEPEHAFIGICGGKVASIARVHWHVYSLDEYQQIPTKELLATHPDAIRKFGWEEGNSVVNQKLAKNIQLASPLAKYDHDSVIIPLNGHLAEPHNMETIQSAVREAMSMSIAEFGAEQAGYSLTIDASNLLRITTTKGKQGIVESADHYLSRNPNIAPMPEAETLKKRELLEEIVKDVILENIKSDTE